MKILFLNYEYPPLGGGAANASACLMEEFSRRKDIAVSVITSSFDESFHSDALGDNVTIYRLPIGKSSSNIHFQSVKDLATYSWKGYRFAQQLLRREKFDVIHAFFTVPCGAMAWKLSREFRVPYIVSLRGSDVPGYSDRFRAAYPFLRPLTRLIWRGAFAVVSNSRGLKDLALQTDEKQEIGIIPNGVDTRHFSPKDKTGDARFDAFSERPIQLTVGASRLTDRKGIRYLIEAIAMLKGKISFAMKIIGEGDAKERLEKMVREKGLSDRVSFDGRIPREETLPYYQEADIFVLPSLNEGMSNAMLEALSCGLPIVSTQTGGAEELVKEGENGLIIQSRDAKDIARALLVLAEKPETLSRMRVASRALAETMSWERVADQYEALYQKTLSQECKK